MSQHKAGYARDKKKGGYLIRVIGPNANRFAGREVPVLANGKTEPTIEKLDALLWTGIDEGEYNPADKGKPVALYSFVARPKGDVDEIPF